ncbi:MAG: hypothetical protein JRD93_10750 [Deltaproteobacteria bacterium]|nr:hypothetical protein [Deltaproteobacteria bacterium]MBW2662444.1 hypothetical protein [Deltaproteobacteria bacterium]
MVKFIHTADIHLDSPLKGLEAHEDAPVEEIRGATRRTYEPRNTRKARNRTAKGA